MNQVKNVRNFQKASADEDNQKFGRLYVVSKKLYRNALLAANINWQITIINSTP